MGDHRGQSQERDHDSDEASRPDVSQRKKDASRTGPDPLELIDECLAAFPDDDPRQKLVYKLRHLLLSQSVAHQQREAEFKKLNDVVAKLTAPANRVGMLLDVPGEGLARIVVGGAEYYTSIDPRVPAEDLKTGTQILVNEAFALIRTLGYDRSGPVLKVAESLPDGRVRFEQDMGRQAMILPRSSDLAGVELKPGDEIRIDPTHRIAIEKCEDPKARTHLLDEVPGVTWEQIGGQKGAIDAIRKAIEYPLLHGDTFKRYQFTQPKGFLLYGPPGCGKTLIGQAAAASLSKLIGQEAGAAHGTGDAAGRRPISTGVFLHVKGPEILNMWLGESERIVRDLFAQARAKREEGALPFIFIDEAESILGTRRSMRSFNINNTLVPMFCAEMDGIESLHDVVIILASNRPDLIDPAVLRPGRIDRKIKVARPDREGAADVLKVYLTHDLPYDPSVRMAQGGDQEAVRRELVEQVVARLFSRNEANRLLAVRLRNGHTKVLYRGDMVSGAILAAIVRRAKEKAIERTFQDPSDPGIKADDLFDAINDEYREGEVLPPDDAAEEWLKLLDHHPEQVVGISSFRRGRQAEERLVGQII
jgi:proteasome-associated ATPase